MKRKVFGKKGSYTVFIAMFMSGMIIMSGAVINAAHTRAIDSASEDLGRVWAGSILGEYDRKLRDRYGFYGYFGDNQMVREKLIRYSDHTFKKKKYIKRTSLQCNLEEYRLTDLNIFRDQMKRSMRSMWRPVPFENDESEAQEEGENRYISAGWILEALPSHSLRGRAVSGSAGSSLMETAYIFKSFKDHVDERDLGKTYFRNEIEYIITGKPNDEKARKRVYQELFAERNALNLVYLYSCTEKRQAALEAAELITPGPEAFITQALILEVWALLEARNDLAILYDGERVPYVKRDCNWALDIDNALDKVNEDKDTGDKNTGDKDTGELDTRESKKYVKPERIEGQTYADHLKTLLIAVPESKRLLRVMDLIQINMKYAYCDHFLMSDLYTGLDYTMTINGKEHSFTDEYK